MKFKISRDGLNIFIPDEEISRIHKIIYDSSYQCDEKWLLLHNLMQLMTNYEIEEIKWRKDMLGERL